MSTSLSVQTRIDPVIKEQAAAVLADMGLSVSDAVRLMLTRVAQDKALPFAPWRPNAETVAAMQQARAGEGKAFDAVEALMADLRSEDG